MYIFSYLDDDLGWLDLFSLSSVCRRFRDVCVGSAYSSLLWSSLSRFDFSIAANLASLRHIESVLRRCIG